MSLFGEMPNIFPLYWDFLYYPETDYRENVIAFFPIWWDILSAIFPYILGCFLLTAFFVRVSSYYISQCIGELL